MFGIVALFLGFIGVGAGNGMAATSPPLISSVQPASGQVGIAVTISGKGFTPTAGFQGTPGGGEDFGGNTIRLGSAVTLKNLNSTDGVTLKFEIPKNVPPGVYRLTIVNANGTSNAVNFTVTDPR